MRSTDYPWTGHALDDARREAYCVGHPGYKVNPLGHLWSCRGRRSQCGGGRVWKEISICLRGRYYIAAVYSDGVTRRDVYVRRLVADAFLGPKPPGHKLCSLDGDTANHRLSNLGYFPADALPEGSKAIRPARKGERRSAKLTDEQAVAVRRRFHEAVVVGRGRPRAHLDALAAEYRVSRRTVLAVVMGTGYRHVDAGVPAYRAHMAAVYVRPPLLTPDEEQAIRQAARHGRTCAAVHRERFLGRVRYNVVNLIWRDERTRMGLGDARKRQ